MTTKTEAQAALMAALDSLIDISVAEALAAQPPVEPPDEEGPGEGEPPASTESPNLTLVGEGGQITDAAGVVYSLVGGKIYKDSVLEAYSDNVKKLFYRDHVVYQFADWGTGSGWFYVRADSPILTDPTGENPPSPPSEGGGEEPPPAEGGGGEEPPPSEGGGETPENPPEGGDGGGSVPPNTSAFPTYRIRPGLVADPNGQFAEVWIELDQPVRHNCYVKVVAGGAYDDGTQGRLVANLWFKTGDPQSQQVLVPLDGGGKEGKTFAVFAWGAGISNNPSDPQNMYTGQSSAVVTFKAGAKVTAVPFKGRADRVPRRSQLLWASAADWSNFKAKRGGGDATTWHDGYDGYDFTNQEPTIYAAKGDYPNSTPWEIQGSDLIVRAQNLGAPVQSKLGAYSKPYAAAIVRGKFLARQEMTMEFTVKQGSGVGNWFALWNLPENGWPPEQDLLESYWGTGSWTPDQTTYTMHADGSGAMVGMKLYLNELFGGSNDQSAAYYTWIMETHNDFTTLWVQHPDGRLKEIGCFPTENGGKKMYPLFDATLWGDPAANGAPMPTGKPAAYENRIRSIKIYA